MNVTLEEIQYTEYHTKPILLIKGGPLLAAGVVLMETKVPKRMIVMTIITVMVMVSGCITSNGDDDIVKTGDLRIEDHFVELGSAQNVEINIEIGTGELKVTPDATKLMEGTFTYNIDKWKPRFTYEPEDDIWNLTIRQPTTDLKVEAGARNEGDLSFGTWVPMEMNVEIGTGAADIAVAGLDLASLSIATGSGDISLDLKGDRYDHLIVRAGTGNGRVNLIVPDYIGVQISPTQGTGTVVAPGFEFRYGNYFNDIFDYAEVFILIAVNIGVGDLVVLETP